MKVGKWLRALCAVLVCIVMMAGSASAEALQKISTAWMGAQEAFPVWYAKHKGWDKELGLEIEMLYFNSGMDAMNTMPAKTWSFAGVGAVPAMFGALRYNSTVIAMCNDEAAANAVLVRPDSNILSVQGFNKDYPSLYGNPETVKGKTILSTNISSAQYALDTWLSTLGLDYKDVTIKNMDQASALAAFEYGLGDAITLWAPLTYVAQSRGWKIVSTPHECGLGLPIVIVADTDYINKNPELTTKFLTLYMRGIDFMKNTDIKDVIPVYLQFYSEWAGSDYSEELAKRDIQNHSIFSVKEQLALFDSSNGPSTIQKWQTEIAKFFAATKRITDADLAKIKDSTYVTDKYLKLVDAANSK